MKKGILGIFVLCVALNATCTRNADETVVCDKSKLMWQDDESAKTLNKNWKEAIRYCEELSLAGYSDWRLPNINELLTIVDRSRYKPAINVAFKNISSDFYWYYWSSTPSAHSTYADYGNAWSVNFELGHTKDYHDKTDNYNVRCVRDAN